MLENEYPNELPTPEKDDSKLNDTTKSEQSSSNIKIEHHTMLKEEPKEKPDEDTGEEKSSIEKKSVYDDLAHQEHFFSKAKLEASADFTKEMHQKMARERERREEMIAEEERKAREKNEKELKELQKYGTAFNFAEFEALETQKDLHGQNVSSLENDMARQLRRQISEKAAQQKEKEEDETDIRLRKGIISAIAVQIILAFLYIPNKIFILHPFAQVAIDVVSVMFVLIAIIILTTSANDTENKKIPKKQNALFISASILPGSVVRLALAIGAANLLNFIPKAGSFIGYAIGIAIGAAIYYGFLGKYKVKTNQAISIICSIVAIILVIIPALISGSADQLTEQTSELGYAIYAIEAGIIILVDEIMFKIHGWRMTHK